MGKNTKNFDIAKLIFFDISGQLSEEENKELKSWIDSSSENKKLYNNVKDEENISNYKDKLDKYNTDKDWEEISKLINKKQNKKILSIIARYAAILILPILITLFFYKISEEKTKITPDYTVYNPLKAVLVLSTGEKVNLFDYSGTIVEKTNSVKVANTEDGLEYYTLKNDVVKEGNSSEIMNTLNVPRQGEYSLTLSDGTSVRLNSESSLTYPVEFKNNKRVVTLEGEAFFIVKKDTNRPFIVKTNDYSVKVLGTRFNINNYKDDPSTAITLVRGKVQINNRSKKSIILKPGQQLSGKRSNMTLKEVDTELFTSWTKGKFIFKNALLEDIALQISRWYDVEVFFANNDTKNIHFSGAILKSCPLRELLDMIEKSGEVSCNINKQCVIISKN